MSRYVVVRTMICDLSVLRKVLKEMGLKLEIGAVAICESLPQDKVDAVVHLKKCDFGLKRQADGSYSIVGDHWMMARDGALGTKDVKGWLDKLNQKYAVEVVRQKALAEGWTEVRTQQEAEGTIVLEFTR